MDKVVIVGVLDFVGFYVCKALLDKGIEVKGIQYETVENKDILEQKRLEIGRNANFSEVSIEDLRMKYDGKETLILSIYDLYMRNMVDTLVLENYISMCKWERIVFLAPSQWLTNANDPTIHKVTQELRKTTKDLNADMQFLYLPTLYGPWQPDTFVFQHTILAGINRGGAFKGLLEETNDALYIEDTIEYMIEIIENEPPGKYLFQSGRKNQWDLCASFLQINKQYSSEGLSEPIEEDDITNLTVKSSIPYSIGLTKQIEQVHRLYG